MPNPTPRTLRALNDLTDAQVALVDAQTTINGLGDPAALTTTEYHQLMRKIVREIQSASRANTAASREVSRLNQDRKELIYVINHGLTDAPSYHHERQRRDLARLDVTHAALPAPEPDEAA